MYQDREEELNRLCEGLLEEEPPAEMPEQERPVIYRNFANNYGQDLRNFASNYTAYNADPTDEDPGELSREVLREEQQRPLWPLIIANLVLVFCILGVLAYWVFGLGVLK